MMGQLGPLSISAGPLISGWQNAIVTPLRAGFGAINVLVPGMQHPRRIGRLIQQTYASTLVFAIPTVSILLNVGVILRGMGTDPAVAAEVQRYMTGYAWGIVPIYGLVIDQQFSLAIRKRRVATMIGLFYAGLVIILGYLLTFHGPSDLSHNTYSLGLSFSLSAWLVNLGLKLFFWLSPDYQPYQLFKLKHFFKDIMRHFQQMRSIFVPMWLQSLSESFNLMVVSILMSRISNDALMAEQVSLQWMTAFSPVILAIANVTCSITSRHYDAFLRCIHQRQTLIGQQVLQQVERQMLASLILASGIGAIFASLFLTIPRALTSLFVPASNDSHQQAEIAALSTTMLRTNSLGVLADTLRITLTGNLLGMRDASIPALVSFLLISGLGLLIGAIGTELFGFGGNFLFILRDIFIVAATMAITGRCFVYKETLLEQAPATEITDAQELRTIPRVELTSTPSTRPGLLTRFRSQIASYGSFFSSTTTSALTNPTQAIESESFTQQERRLVNSLVLGQNR